MDDRTGQLYESVDAAVAAKVPAAHIRPIVHDDPLKCAMCGKSVRARKSTPTRVDDRGRVHRWCKRCWFHRLSHNGPR